MRESLTARAREFNIVLDDVAITHLSFGTEVGQQRLDSASLHSHMQSSFDTGMAYVLISRVEALAFEEGPLVILQIMLL